jgi:hypothetical protein
LIVIQFGKTLKSSDLCWFSVAASTASSQSYMKHASLILLTLQNAASLLLLRYVRTQPGPRFINSSAVFSSEVLKTIASVLLLIREEGSARKGLRSIYEKLKYHPKDTIKTGIPALLYTLQNNLIFIAISNLDAATCQVCLLGHVMPVHPSHLLAAFGVCLLFRSAFN